MSDASFPTIPAQQSTEELLSGLGRALRELRLAHNMGQVELSRRAGVGRSAVQNLESGHGNLTTLVRVVRALGRTDWLLALAPATTVNPLHMMPHGKKRRRASRRRRGDQAKD